MAGQGYRTWVAGEQLTDTKMQQYLQDQSVMRFANSAARGSALTGVVSEGMVSYLDDVNRIEVYNGTAWAQVTPDVPNATPGTAGIVFGRTPTTDTATTSYGRNSAASATAGAFTGNLVIGNNSATSLSTGHNNVVSGNQSALSLASGTFNTFVGNATGFVMNGDGNTALGFAAAYSWGSTGNNNTCVGSGAGGTAVPSTYSGSNNTLLGYNASPSSNSVSNEITLGNSSIATIRAQVTSITALSDERDKTDIEPLEYGLDFVNELNPVSFTWNMRDGAKVGELDFGFIAQQLAEVEDKHEADRLKLTLRTNPEKLETTPGRLIPILVKAVQELSAKVEELEAKLNG